MSSESVQERIALAVVAITVLIILVRFLKNPFLRVSSHWLLKKGHVKWAMRLHRAMNSRAGCSNCNR